MECTLLLKPSVLLRGTPKQNPAHPLCSLPHFPCATQALHNIAESVMRSLKSLLTPERTLLLKIAVLLPGTIDAELVHRLLGVQPSKAQSLLNRQDSPGSATKSGLRKAGHTFVRP